MNDFSQSGEQEIILRYFREYNGSFLDIGANDGVTLSNTRALALLGWGGVLVEPAPTPFGKLKELYSDRHDVMCVEAAIAPKDGLIEFWESGTHFNKGDSGLLSTMKEGEIEQWKHLDDKFTLTTVRGIAFQTLVNECGQSRFDFISIDCEGVDYEVLSQIDLFAAGCKMLCVETNGRENEKYIEYAGRFGLSLHDKNQHNLIFAL